MKMLAREDWLGDLQILSVMGILEKYCSGSGDAISRIWKRCFPAQLSLIYRPSYFVIISVSLCSKQGVWIRRLLRSSPLPSPAWLSIACQTNEMSIPMDVVSTLGPTYMPRGIIFSCVYGGLPPSWLFCSVPWGCWRNSWGWRRV